MRFRRPFLLFTVVTVLTGCWLLPADGVFNVAGRVTDPGGGPISNATITVECPGYPNGPLVTTTDNYGCFSFSLIVSPMTEECDVTVDADGLAPFKNQLPSGTKTVSQFSLQLEGSNREPTVTSMSSADIGVYCPTLIPGWTPTEGEEQ